MSLEGGRIVISLGAGPARIETTRRTDVARLFAGRTGEEVPVLLPALFALCGQAHAAAARLALFGEIGADQVRLTLAETAREHLLRILMGWRAEGWEPLPTAPVMALVGTARGGGGDVAAALAGYLQAHVLGRAPEAFLEQAELAAWLDDADTAPASFLRGLIAGERASLGAVEPAFLPALAPGDLAARMSAPGFAARPEWDGPRETGPLARQHAHPLVASVIARHGAGLLARLVARLVELARLPEMIRTARAAGAAPGLGVIETARGRLIHAARIEAGRVAHYAILAPTEWNFHPRGVAAQALAGLAPEEAGAVVEAIDPCVDYELRVA